MRVSRHSTEIGSVREKDAKHPPKFFEDGGSIRGGKKSFFQKSRAVPAFDGAAQGVRRLVAKQHSLL